MNTANKNIVLTGASGGIGVAMAHRLAKRGAHLFSKHRYLSAQMAGYLENGLWLDLARHANANAAQLVEGLSAAGAEILHEVDVNMIFARLPRSVHQRLHDAGAMYYLWEGSLKGDDPHEMLAARFVCDWSIKPEQIEQFVKLLSA